MKYHDLLYKLPRHFGAYREGKKSFLSSIYEQRFYEQNFFLSAVGMPGSGKSTALLKILWELQVDPVTGEQNFDPDKQVVFNAKDCLKLVEQTDYKKNPGYCILFDEIEIDANARGWDSISRQLELMVSTMRFKTNILAASLPHERQLLKSVRRLRHSYLDCRFVIQNEKAVYAKYYYLKYDMTADTNKFTANVDAKKYLHRFHAYDKNNIRRKYKLSSLRVKLPPKDIVKRYKAKKTDFLDTFYRKAIKQIEEEENKKKEFTFSKFAEFVDRNKDSYILKTDGKKQLNPILLANDLGIKKTVASDYCKAYLFDDLLKQQRRSSYID